MKAIQRIKNNRLLKLLGFLFLAINLITVIIGGVSCIYTVSQVKSVVTEYNTADIDNVRSMMEMRLASGEKLAQSIYLSVNLSDFSGGLSEPTPGSRVTITKLMESISYGVDANSIIANAYVYFPDYDRVVSDKGFFTGEFYYENYVPHKGISFDKWKTQLSDTAEPNYRAATLDYSTYEVPVTEYSRPFNLYSRNLRGCVVIQYSNEAIIATLDRNKLMSDASTLIRYVPTAAVIVEVGNPETLDFLKKQDLASGQRETDETSVGNLVLVRQTSLDRDWEYLTAIPTDVFYRRINTMIAIMLWIVAFQCLSGVILAFLFSERSYRPIRSMTDRIRSMAQNMTVSDEGGDMEYIQKITATAIGEYGRAKEELDAVRPVVTKSFLVQLLRGGSLEREYARANLSDRLEIFPEKGFLCVKIAVEECAGFAREQSIEEMQLVRLAVSNISEEILGESFRVTALDFDLKSVVLLINSAYTADQTQRTRLRETLEECLKRCQTIFEEKFRIYTSIGVSQFHEGISSLYQCHTEAQRALDQNAVSDVYGVSWYQENLISKNEYHYSLEDEVYLINSAKTGNFEQVKTILDELVSDNAAVFNGGNTQMAQCFVMDLIGTLLRVVSEVNIPEKAFSISIGELLSLPSFSKMLQGISGCYETVCAWINQNKKSHNSQTKERVEQYIAEHYLDNSLSLVGVADHLGMNPTYLSAFIKEQFGETFLNYVVELRMEKAKELLRTTNLSLQDIAVRIGYANSGVFIRVFKKKFGRTPGDYRTNDAF